MADPFRRQWAVWRDRVERSLDRCLPPAAAAPTDLHQAMRHSVFAGGKRLRAVLALAAARAVRPDRPPGPAVTRAACALELVHTYSLIHDDLPAMDDDDLRRGRPTCHVVFGEATAILAGDALLTLAFQLLATQPRPPAGPDHRLRGLAELATAAGTPAGMVAGQALDMAGGGGPPDPARLEAIHHRKTGALIRAAALLGGWAAQAPANRRRALAAYGTALGLAFQITDDLLDLTASPEQLGKTPGKDRRQGKLTFPAVFGPVESRVRAAAAVADARNALAGLPPGPGRAFLAELAGFVLDRRN